MQSLQNPYDGKNKLAGGIRNESNNRCTPASAATRTLILTITPVIIPLVASGSANSFVVRYLEDDLQWILRTVLDFRPPAPVPAPIVAAAQYYEGPRKRPLKDWFLDIYWDKTHLECYNFFQ